MDAEAHHQRRSHLQSKREPESPLSGDASRSERDPVRDNGTNHDADGLENEKRASQVWRCNLRDVQWRTHGQGSDADSADGSAGDQGAVVMGRGLDDGADAEEECGDREGPFAGDFVGEVWEKQAAYESSELKHAGHEAGVEAISRVVGGRFGELVVELGHDQDD